MAILIQCDVRERVCVYTIHVENPQGPYLSCFVMDAMIQDDRKKGKIMIDLLSHQGNRDHVFSETSDSNDGLL